MWMLKRVIHPNEFEVCTYSEEIIHYKDFYFQSYEDPSIKVKADVFESLKRQYIEDNFDRTLLEAAIAEESSREDNKEAKKLEVEQMIYDSVGTESYERRGY